MDHLGVCWAPRWSQKTQRLGEKKGWKMREEIWGHGHSMHAWAPRATREFQRKLPSACSSASKRKEIHTPATTGVKLEDIMLSDTLVTKDMSVGALLSEVRPEIAEWWLAGAGVGGG